MKQIAIIGLGLIGGSIGMGLRSSGLPGIRIIGYSQSSATRSRARERGAIDEAAGSLSRAVEEAGLVILATPVKALESILREIASVLPAGAVVTDAASTKICVLQWASEALPAEISFVGGHPMAGKEVAGIDAAEPGLFRDCTYCICPSPSASSGAIELVAGLASSLGARPYFVDPVEHDSFVAGISHLPMLLSTALASVTTNSPAWTEMSRLASSGYRDTTRLASSDPIMSRDIYLTNTESLGHWTDMLITELQSLRRDMSGDGNELESRLRRIKDARDRWQRGELPAGRPAPVEAPAAGWGHFLLGNLPSMSRPPRKKS